MSTHDSATPGESPTPSSTTTAPPTRAYAATSATTDLQPFSIKRRAVGPHDVHLQILYCGVCHSDLHQVRNEWKNTIYPCVPGHEIVGKVVEVGTAVTRFRPGDLAGV